MTQNYVDHDRFSGLKWLDSLAMNSEDSDIQTAAEILRDALERSAGGAKGARKAEMSRGVSVVSLRLNYTVVVKDHRHAAGLAVKAVDGSRKISAEDIADDPLRIVLLLNEADGWHPERYDQRALDVLDKSIGEIRNIPMGEAEQAGLFGGH